MDSLAGQLAVVTGASSGIGRALALEMACHGADICLVGRSEERLASVARDARELASRSSRVNVYRADLASDEELQKLIKQLYRDCSRINVLVHAAGIVSLVRAIDAPVSDLDSQFYTNVRAPYVLTQAVLPMLVSSRGQVVFVNSSVSLRTNASATLYATTKHALRALADNLRDELNPQGVRVLSVYPGRTATPGQEEIHREEGKPYHPELLLQPSDIAQIVVAALCVPRTAEVTDISIRPMRKT